MNNKFLCVLLVSLSLFSLSCRKAGQDGASNVLQVSLSDEISSLDPAESYDTISASVVYQVYEQLYQYHYLKRPYVLEPLLAEGMPKVEENGTKYTIKIRSGVRYHADKAFKGAVRTVKAQDFVDQIKRLAFKANNSNGWWLFDGKIKGLNDFREKAGSDFKKFKELGVEGLQAPDDQTLVIRLTAPYPQMLYSLAMSFTSPMPMEAIEAYNNSLHEVMVGTGPFQLEEWNHQGILKLKKFADYHEAVYPTQGDRQANEGDMLKDAGQRLPFLEGVHFHIMKESQTRWLNFQAKKIDFAEITKDNFESAIDANGNLTPDLKAKNIKLHITPRLTYWWTSFNMKDPILGKNKNLHLAIAHAIDVDKYIQVFTNNIGQKANSIYPPGIPGYDPAHQLTYEYNQAKAKEYLAKAGYAGGKGLPALTYDVRGSSTTNRQQAEFIAAELEKIGVKINIVLNTFPAFLEKARKGQLQLWQDGWAMDYPDAENCLQLLSTKNHAPGPNATFYSNPKFDQLFERVKLLEEGPEKRKLMVEMEKLVHDDLPWVMQYYARSYTLYHDYLKNYRHSDLVTNNLKYLRLIKQ